MTQTDLQAGAVLGGYEIEREVGRGALGIVYLARHLHLGRSAALKVMHPYWTASDEFSKRFREEARLLALLEHPSILRVYDAGEVDGVFYIATQYLEGRTLEQLLQRTVPLQATLLIAQQLASALAYAHRAGVIHRDVKPANVMVSPHGTVTLMDFGVARFADSPAMTMPGVQVGTPFYMAPELIFGRRADARSDVYALGVVLHQVLSGAPPFPGPDTETVFRGHLNEQPPELGPEIPDWVKQVIGRALAKKPEERFQTADDLLAAIRAGVRSGEIAPPNTGAQSALQSPADEPAPTADSPEPVSAPPSADSAAAPSGEAPAKAGDTPESPRAEPQSGPSGAAPAPGSGPPGVSMVRHYRTVLSLDIAGSSFMKQPGLTLAVHHKFALFREYVKDRLEGHRVLQSAWAGDGLMALFERPADGGLCARAILDGLEAFNKKQGGEPIRVRLGVHTGPILMDSNQPLGEITSSTLDIAGHLQKHSGEDSILASERIFAALENPQSWQPAGPEFNLAFSTPIYRYTLKEGPFPAAPSVSRIASPAAVAAPGATPSRAAASGPLELSRLIDELMESAASEARGPDSLTLLAPHDETAPSPWEADLESMPEGTPPVTGRSGLRVPGVSAPLSARTTPSSGSPPGQVGAAAATPPASPEKKAPLPASENVAPAKSGAATPGPGRPAENRGTYSLRQSGPGASGANATPPAEARLRLEIRTGARVEVREVLGTTLFGRPDPGASPGPKIEIVDDDAISRRHARIRLDQGRYVLEDLESANGTNLNGDWIEPLQPRPLYPGDEIQMGEHTTIRVLAR